MERMKMWFKKKKVEYKSYSEFSKIVAFREQLKFQQDVRSQNCGGLL